jgi:phosphoenolpyruvate phosphomutase
LSDSNLLSTDATLRRTTRLKRLIQRREMGFLMEAHNGLSARIVEEAGFEGIWASGLSISAALGVRDHNEASWTQVLEVAEFMADATTIPILVDGDTGYGDFNSMRRLVRKLEQRGVAGVCIEDKIFPKKNSFIHGSRQPLADMVEFAGKIQAGKDAASDPDFCVVARVEALIAGWGLEEALRRAEVYRLAGADAILIHSKEAHPGEILAFMDAWGDRLPVVIVPTKYYTTPTDRFRAAGVSVVVWANHLMRSALAAMQRTAALIHEQESLIDAEASVAPLREVFRIQGEPELEDAEKRYLPAQRQARAIVLAASRGSELGELTAHRPKCMVPLAGKPLLSHIVDALRRSEVGNITVVRGYCKEAVSLMGLHYVDNDAYAETQELASLQTARSALDGLVLISYGDVVVKPHIVAELLAMPDDIAIAVDPNWRLSRNSGARKADLVSCSQPYGGSSFLQPVQAVAFHSGAGVDQAEAADGEWIGLVKLSPAGSAVAREGLDALLADPAAAATLKMPDLLQAMQGRGQSIGVLYTSGAWLDVDTVADLVDGVPAGLAEGQTV